MALNYIATCQGPTSVTASVSGFFVNLTELNLLVAKYHRVEMFKVAEKGLNPIFQFTVYGKVTNMAAFRKKNENQDFLIMLTSCLNISILVYSSSENTFITLCTGCLKDRLRRCTEGEPLLQVDPTNSYALIRVFDSILKVISLDVKRDGIINMYNVRFNELYTSDIVFISSNNSAYLHLAIIYKDRDSTNFRSYLLRIKDMELKDGPYGLPCIEEGSTIVLATNSMEGAIIIGKQTVILVGNGECVSVSPPALVGEEPIQIACQIGRKKASTYLLGDCQGNLYILSVLKGIKVTRIGSMTFASSMTYLDNGVVFIGSCVSDSQLIQLNKKPVDNAYFTVLETYANIGPIIDMELFDAKSQDWPRMITCSGCDKWGSLRVLTNGIEIDEICALPFSRFKSAFPLKLSMNCNGKDDSLMFSNFEQSVILEQQDNGFALCKAECFIRDASTLYVGNVVYDQVLQISKKEIRLIRVKDLKAICLFSCISAPISSCYCNGWQFVISSKNTVTLFSISDGGFEKIKFHEFNFEVSCLTIYFLNFLTPLRLTEENGIGPANVMAVSFWNETTIELYSLPDFKFIAKDSFDFKTLIRSIVFMEFKPNFVYLLVAMGAGGMYLYHLFKSDSILSVRTKNFLGTSPINLVPFWMKGSSIHQDLVPGGDKIVNYPPLTEPRLLSCSDRTSIIYFDVFKVGFSYTSKNNVFSGCPYNSSVYEGCMILISDEKVTISRISDISAINIVTVPIFEEPRKIVYQQDLGVFGLLTIRAESQAIRSEHFQKPQNQRPYSLRLTDEINVDLKSNCQIDVSCFQIINQETFEPLYVHPFPFFEIASSLACYSCKPQSLFVVGTGLITEIGEEPTSGRVVLYQFCDNVLTLVTECSTKGSVQCIDVHNELIICCVTHSLLIFVLRPDDNLLCLQNFSNHVTSMYVKSMDDTIIVGDLIRSLAIYKVIEEGEISLVAKSSNTEWLTAVAIVDKDNYLYCNMDGCLCIATYPTDSPIRNELLNLEISLAFNLDQHVNVFKNGSLNYNNVHSKNIKNTKSILFGTISGMIGVMMDLPPSWLTILKQIQSIMINRLHSAGNIDYSQWRNTYSEKFKLDSRGMIDGDVLDGFISQFRPYLKEILEPIEDGFESNTSIEAKMDQVTSYINDLMHCH